MTYPIEPIMNDMSEFNKQQYVVTQELSQAQSFIQAFSERLRCFAQSSRSFELSQSVNDLYEQLLIQLHLFDSCSYDFGWLMVLVSQLNQSQESAQPTCDHLALFRSIKQCYKHIHDIGNDSFQDLLLSLKGSLYLMKQYSSMVPQRHVLSENGIDTDDRSITVLSDMASNTSSTVFEDHESTQQVIDFLDLNPHLSQSVSISPKGVLLNQDGSVNVSSIRPFLVDSMFQVDQNQGVYIECPIMFTECVIGTEMAILYHSDQVHTVTDLFEYPNKHYCFSCLAADYVLSMDGIHPITRESVDSMVRVKLDSLHGDDRVSLDQDVVFYDKKIQDLIAALSKKTDVLLTLFDDMVSETFCLHQALETLTQFINGYDVSLESCKADSESLEEYLQTIKQFHLALEHQSQGLFETIGYSDLLGDMVHSVALLYQHVGESFETNSHMLLSLHETGLDGLSRDLEDVIVEASDVFPEHQDIYAELYDLHMTVKKFIRQLEQRLSVYRRCLERLLQLSHPDYIEKKMIKECEFMIIKLTQKLSSLLTDC